MYWLGWGILQSLPQLNCHSNNENWNELSELMLAVALMVYFIWNKATIYVHFQD